MIWTLAHPRSGLIGYVILFSLICGCQKPPTNRNDSAGAQDTRGERGDGGRGPKPADRNDSAGAQDIVLRGIHAILSSTFEGQSINVLDSPVPLKNTFDVPTGRIDSLSVFDRVPKRSKFRFDPGNDEIGARLKELIPGVEIGTIELPPEDADRLKKAKQVLFQDGDETQPRQVYRKYMDLLAKIRKIEFKLKDPTNPPTEAEKNALQFELSELRDEWNKPWRSPIDEAVDTMAKLAGERNVRDKFKEWKEMLTQPAVAGSYNALWESLSIQDGWVALTFPVKVEQGLAIAAKQAAGDAEPEKEVTVQFGNSKVLTVSMRLARVAVSRPALEHSFLKSKSWTNKRWVISKGEAEQNGDADIELVPRFVSNLIVIREIELDFPDTKSWKAAADALRGTGPASIGGIAVAKDDLFISPKHISYARPQIIAVIVRRMFRSPDPDQRLKF